MTRACCLALVAGLWSSSLHAHEIGSSQAFAVFQGAEYQIDVAVDPDTLLSKLEAFGGRPVSHGLSRTERDSRIREQAEVFLAETGVQFDGEPVRPRFDYLPASAFSDLAQSPSVVRLTGRVPSGAGRFIFQYRPAMGTYALNLRIGDRPVETQWIVGGAPSEPISLSARASPLTRADVARQYLTLGFTHIVPHGLDYILFVLGIFLLSSRWRSVVAQVSTFTLAHSITLALTMCGIVSLRRRWSSR